MYGIIHVLEKSEMAHVSTNFVTQFNSVDHFSGFIAIAVWPLLGSFVAKFFIHSAVSFLTKWWCL